ncbi:hypothetical protein ACG3SL_11815 [Sphingomonas sp. CJ20]
MEHSAETQGQTPPPSLAQRLGSAGREGLRAMPRGDARIGLAVAALIAVGPVLTLAGAHVLAGRVAREVQALSAAEAPREAKRAEARQARELLAPVLARPGLTAVMDAVARSLPEDARLARVERGADGALEIDATAPDPDAVRSALRREPLLARLRDSGQRRGDGAMVASFRSEGE